MFAMLSYRRPLRAGHQWRLVKSSESRANHQTHRGETKGCKTGDGFIRMQEEKGHDSSGCSHQHRRVSANRVCPSPVESASNTNKRPGEKNGAGNVQVQIHRSRRGVVQTPKHE